MCECVNTNRRGLKNEFVILVELQRLLGRQQPYFSQFLFEGPIKCLLYKVYEGSLIV